MEATAVVRMMTEAEARFCVNEIKRGMFDIRYLVLDLYQREGWRALGYKNWQECKEREFEESARHVERLLMAAQIEQDVRPAEDTTNWSHESPVEPIPESHLRPLTSVQPEVRREVWTKAVESAPEGKVTAKHVEQTVVEWKANRTQRDDPAIKPSALGAKTPRDDTPPVTDDEVPKTVTLRVARVVYLMALGRWMTIEEIASITGLSLNGAWRLLDRLAGGHHVPVTDDEEGKWGILETEPQDWPY